MTRRFQAYYDKIQVSEQHQNRDDEIFSKFAPILSEEVEDIFVTNIVDAQGTKIFNNLWFFTKSVFCESKSFLVQNNLDFLRKEKMNYFEMSYQDIHESKTELLMLKLYFQSPIMAQLTATGSNLECLQQIILKHVKPYM
jgi:hypothetical protein